MATKNNYQILWLDDKFDPKVDSEQLLIKTKDRIIRKCRSYGKLDIQVAAYAESFAQTVKDHPNHFDAVILDVRGNVNETDTKTTETEAFYVALSSLVNNNYEGVIMILSGETSITKQENDTFFSSLRLVKLSANDILDKKDWLIDHVKFGKEIMRRIDDKKTIAHQLRCLYPDAFSAVQSLEEEEWLIKLLANNFSSAQERYDSGLAHIRNLLEKIKDKLRSKNIIPPINNLNQLVRYFSNFETNDGYKISSEDVNPMHSVEVYMLKTLLDISNDAKHYKQKLTLHVAEYMNQFEENHLLQSLSFLVIDILNWYERIWQQYPSILEPGIMWTEIKFECCNVVVQADSKNQSYYYVEYKKKEKLCKCLLAARHEDCEGNPFEPGDSISIKTSPSKSTNPKYDYYAEVSQIINV